jgi:4-hydroxymandelate synthase
MSTEPLAHPLVLGYVELYVADPATAAAPLIEQYSFTPVAEGGDESSRSIALAQGQMTLVLTQGISDEHPATRYVLAHGDGVANIALLTDDVAASMADAVRRGARTVTSEANDTIVAFGDVVHTFVSRQSGRYPGRLTALAPQPQPSGEINLLTLDHFAVCVEGGELDATVDYYQRVLGLELTFTERIEVGAQAMNSKVVQSPDRTLTLTVIEPDTSAAPGQIDEFVKNNDGAGVQHLAFSTDDAVRTVAALSARGVRFLSTPGAYYDTMNQRVTPAAHTLDELRSLNLLIDTDHGGQLFQIFTASTHERRTLFFEIIERLGAKTFGTSNITALYQAVEQERLREHGQQP